MRQQILFIGLILAFSIGHCPARSEAPDSNKKMKSFYDYTMEDLDGRSVDLKKYKDKVLLVVNTASFCGYTQQYDPLTKIYEKYKDQGFVVLGFPANNFGKQEPGTSGEIKAFCTTNYSVTFPLFSKVSVLGKDQHPLFKYLTKQKNPDFTGNIKWNFEKFLIGRDGRLLHRYRSKVTPESEELTQAILKALEKPVKSNQKPEGSNSSGE